jgi:sulfoxide reductase heme-binding subunit YedZ
VGEGVHIFWVLSRGAGIAAIVFAGLSVSIGLLCGRGMPFPRLRKQLELKPLHEALSIATIVLVAAHGLILLGDPWLNPGPAGISIPFVMSYRPLWTGVGIIAGYGLALLGLSYYLRRWIGPSRWRIAHRFIVLFWMLGLVHTFGAGTDATQPWVWLPVALTSSPALALLLVRVFSPSRKPGPAGGESNRSQPRTVMIERH